MSENKKLIPKRRFKEFQNADAWEKRELDKLADFSKGIGYSKSDLVSTGEPVILYGRLYTNYETVIRDIDTFVNDISNSVLSKGGEVIVPSSGETAEDISRASVVDFTGIALGGDLNIIYPKAQIDSTFLALTISNGNQKKELSKRAQGKSVVHIRNEDLKKVLLVFPKKEEQKLIGRFFCSLDQTIAFQQRKLEKMKSMKSAYLSEMFPAEGEHKPKRRFPGFTDDWEQCELGEVLSGMYNGQTPSRFSAENWGGKINWLTSGELNQEVVMKTIEKITPIGQKDANLRVVPEGTFIMAITGLEAAGTRGSCARLGIPTTLNQSCMALFPKENLLDSGFLFQWYKKIGESYGLKYTQGTKQQSYNAELVKILPIILPNVAEQKAISNFLDNLDQTIAFQQQKLEKLQNIKKAYLNEMFI